MTQFDEAARGASNDIFNSPNLEVLPTVEATPKKMKDDMTEIITKHFADIEAVYGKLVELADATTKAANLQGTVNMCKAVGMGIDPEWVEQLREAGGVITRLISDPQVKSAIERSKG